jgi:hypothetical protein
MYERNMANLGRHIMVPVARVGQGLSHSGVLFLAFVWALSIKLYMYQLAERH